MNQRRFLVAAFGSIFLCRLGLAQTFTTSVNVSNERNGQVSSSLANPGYASLASGSSGAAVASASLLGASAQALASTGDVATSDAERSVNDWTISAPLADAGMTTTGSLWFNIAGALSSDSGYGLGEITLSANIVDESGASPVTVFNADVYWEQEGTGGGGTDTIPYVGTGGYMSGSPTFASYVEAATDTYSNYGGAVAALLTGADVYTDPITWTAGNVYTVDVELTAYASNDATQPVSDSALFYNTLTFATDHSVIGLPTGWTVNSSQSNVINNTFAAVPEPQPLAVCAFGLLGLLASKRRRKA